MREQLVFPDFLKRRVDYHYNVRYADSWGGKHIIKGRDPDQNSILLMSNDYLSLGRHPEIIKAQIDSLNNKGSGLLIAGVFNHGDTPERRFEKRLSDFMHVKDSMLGQSGYSINVGLIQSIADRSVPVYIDYIAHYSLWEGIKSAGAKAVPFKHNNMDDLKQKLKKFGAGVIVVDSIYSTNGSICPLAKVVDIAHSSSSILIVDESHSLGACGPDGAGLIVEQGLENYVHFTTVSLAKVFAGRGGILSGPKRILEYFRFEAYPMIFSSYLLPHDTAGYEKTLDVIKNEPWRRDRLHYNSIYLKDKLLGLGYNVAESESHIISLEAGCELNVIILKEALEKRGIFGSPFAPPATSKNRSLIRFSLHCSLTQDDLDRVIKVCADIRDEVGMWDWASTKRGRLTKSARLRTRGSSSIGGSKSMATVVDG